MDSPEEGLRKYEKRLLGYAIRYDDLAERARRDGLTELWQSAVRQADHIRCSVNHEPPLTSFQRKSELSKRVNRILAVLRTEPCTMDEIIAKIGTVTLLENVKHIYKAESGYWSKCDGHVNQVTTSYRPETLRNDLNKLIREGRVTKMEVDYVPGVSRCRVMYFFKE